MELPKGNNNRTKKNLKDNIVIYLMVQTFDDDALVRYCVGGVQLDDQTEQFQTQVFQIDGFRRQELGDAFDGGLYEVRRRVDDGDRLHAFVNYTYSVKGREHISSWTKYTIAAAK